MLATEEKRYTVEDYERLEEGAPYQLISGDLVMTPSPTPFHQHILYKLILSLGFFIEREKLGILLPAPLDVYLTENDVYQPDLIFICAEHAREVRKDKLHIIPDLVVEVLSPSTAYHDFTRKKEIYCACGVTEYWIIDPEQETIEIMIKHGDIYQTESFLRKPAMLESGMFPGFGMKIEDVFAF